MGKPKSERRLPKDAAEAKAAALRTSARKLNLVAGLIRGMNVSDALTQLNFSAKRIANDVRKGLQSAIANAENNHNLNVDSLYVKEAYVGKNIVMKRMHTRGRGKSARIFKPFANLTVVLRERGEEPKAAAPKPEKKAAKKPATKAKKETK